MTVTAVTLFLFSLCSIGWLIGWITLVGALPRIKPDSDFSGPKTPPRVSIVLPVRNEEENIERCLKSLLAQNVSNLEVIVIDDRSEDSTPEILKQIEEEHLRTTSRPAVSKPSLKIIQGIACPPDWMGKNHALEQGYQEASGDFLLFIDADTHAHPKLVEKTVGFALQSGTGLLTLVHSCEFQCFWDSVVNTVIAYLALYQNVELFNDPGDPKANAHGPFMLFRRDVYEAIGGHRAIKGEVVEDLVIAQRVKAAGFRLTWAMAPELFTSRPYSSLSDLRKGWGKVLFRGMELNPKQIKSNLFLPFLLLLYMLLPWGVLALAIIPGVLDWAGPARLAVMALALTQICSTVAGIRFVQIQFRLEPVYPWSYALGAVMLSIMQWEACYRVLTGRKVLWKGRQYGEEEN